ncbi:hypothetical protein BO94DRAFT_590786 [Aspergillus sclerotioniger CBS 115572]|uniref:BTB domain-containing protein n=1 Tax=Aspergillus sclerotioniger CBS 115572 TaxID=1450535 RepID=A0A317V555_9EURO|nr:hypothetical protein BO94DRAFT_590786 [Aspergillus sclerotioniger CBS 115572]PWY67972.1 hypothetical protein BO94DRAFT_590786 [Aspergillus sclerotioniger CBS 115572]
MPKKEDGALPTEDDRKDSLPVSAFTKHLQTPTIALHTETQSYNIHPTLLQTKCPILYALLTNPNYECQEFGDLYLQRNQGIVSAFLDWIYTGTYPLNIDVDDDRVATPTSTDDKVPKDQAITNSLPHHIRVYIFAGSYHITRLKDIAFKHICYITDDYHWCASDCITTSPLIASARLALTSLAIVDPLTSCILELMASKIEKVKMEAGFPALIRDFPDFALGLIDLLGPFDKSDGW